MALQLCLYRHKQLAFTVFDFKLKATYSPITSILQVCATCHRSMMNNEGKTTLVDSIHLSRSTLVRHLWRKLNGNGMVIARCWYTTGVWKVAGAAGSKEHVKWIYVC